MQPDAYRTCPKCLAVFRSPFSTCPQDGVRLAPLVDDPLVGETVAGRYAIDDYVGEGGMARVYRARDLRDGRPVAVKVLFGELAADRRMRARFTREATTARTLDHPNLVAVRDFGDAAGGLAFLVMDFVEGVPLATVIMHEAPLALARVVRLAHDVCLGLEHAHARGLVHRDLKPDNIMLQRTGGAEVPRIIDFGLAIVAGDAGSRVTTGRNYFGTPSYMAPEQARVYDEVDGRADLYSLGATIRELLIGVAGVPEALGALVTRLLDVDRARRPASAAEVAVSLAEIARGIAVPAVGESISSRPTEPLGDLPELVPPPPRRR